MANCTHFILGGPHREYRKFVLNGYYYKPPFLQTDSFYSSCLQQCNKVNEIYTLHRSWYYWGISQISFWQGSFILQEEIFQELWGSHSLNGHCPKPLQSISGDSFISLILFTTIKQGQIDCWQRHQLFTAPCWFLLMSTESRQLLKLYLCGSDLGVMGPVRLIMVWVRSPGDGYGFKLYETRSDSMWGLSSSVGDGSRMTVVPDKPDSPAWPRDHQKRPEDRPASEETAKAISSKNSFIPFYACFTIDFWKETTLGTLRS